MKNKFNTIPHLVKPLFFFNVMQTVGIMQLSKEKQSKYWRNSNRGPRSQPKKSHSLDFYTILSLPELNNEDSVHTSFSF